MKEKLIKNILQAIDQIDVNGDSLAKDIDTVVLERTKSKEHGDFACNIAMKLAKKAKCPPRQLAEKIIERLDQAKEITKVEIAGPGFINFYLVDDVKSKVIDDILSQQTAYGQVDIGQGQKVNLEFVSANPTGPLHVGHGRGAAYGSAVANLLTWTGYDVVREYYVNDAGRQMDILALSTWLRYLELSQVAITFPSNAYKGDYVKTIAEALKREKGDALVKSAEEIFVGVSADAGVEGGDKERHVDDLIARAKQLLDQNFAFVHQFGLAAILVDIQHDLSEFGVEMDCWFSEKQLVCDGAIAGALAKLDQQGLIYEKDGAKWFRSSQLGDEKDRVLVRENGQSTYFASDVAYLLNKFNRGCEQLIVVLGADHHGYVPRLRSIMQSFEFDQDKLTIPLVQFAVLYRGTEQVQMSTRSGSFVTLRELREEVGTDATRFFYLMRKCEQHLDFDLDLAKSNSNENPVYYIQYAHARICSIWRQLEQQSWAFDQSLGLDNKALLEGELEGKIIDHLAKFEDTLVLCTQKLEPHLLVYYCRELANYFHSYYNSQQVLVDDDRIRNARLCLMQAVKQVLTNAFKLLGITLPQEM